MNPSDTTPRIVVSPASPDTQHRMAARPPNRATVAMPTPDASASPATVSGAQDDLYVQYAILGKIGDGGMGIVYLASDRRLGRHVAIKRLKANAQGNPNLRRRFLHEARAAAALAHPHIVHFYSLGEDAEGPYIVMEYIGGALPGEALQPGAPTPPQTLEQYIERRGALPPDTAIELLLKLSKAVAYAHSRSVIHRDLKPANILMDPSGEPKIVDFGLARILRPEESQMTAPGEKLLSLGYGAPEQESDASVSDERADVYGLGAILYFTLTAQNPRYFREEDLPAALRPVLCKAMARDREQRWPDVGAFASALRALQDGAPAAAPTVKTTWRCKWCDTINPVSTHFCAECGWDGGETCLECGADTHFGIPFCKICGANARDYEQVAITVAKTRQNVAQGLFEVAIAHASRAIVLEPTGPNGRRMLEKLRDLRTTAEASRTRQEQLREWIPMEIQTENYERAARFIEEFRERSGKSDAFAQELAQIPEQTLRRDLKRVSRCFREQDWKQGERLLHALEALHDSSDPEFRKLAQRLRRRRQRSVLRRILAGAAALAVLYLLALPPALRLVEPSRPQGFDPAFRAAFAVYGLPPLRAFWSRYASLWNIPPGAMTASAPAPSTNGNGEAPAAREAEPAQEEQLAHMARLQQSFQEQASENLADYRNNMASWPPEYRRELQAQRARHQSLGDYGGWHAVDRELSRFESNGGILPPASDDPEDLKKLKNEYLARIEGFQLSRMRRLVSSTKRFVNELGILLRELTKTGNMEAAERVDREIARLRSDPEYGEAERMLTEYETSRPEDLPTLLAAGSGEIEALRVLRSAYEGEIRTVEAEHAARLETWPSQYTAALQRFMEARLREGDYPGWEAANLESTRFELDGTLAVPEASDAEPPLDAIKRRHVELRRQYDESRARGIVKVSEAYVGKLDRLVSEYTKARKIDAAAAATAELRRIRASAEYLEALGRIAREPEAPPPP